MADAKRPTILALRTTGPDGRPYHDAARRTGFAWPVGDDAVGQRVEAPGWSPVAECGGGLHGLLWGAGGAGYLSSAPDAVWQVVEVEACDVVDLGDKIKFPTCIIRYSGSRAGASEYLWARAPAGTRIVRAALTGGDGSNLNGGDRSTLTWRLWDGRRYRIHTIYPGEDGIKPGTAYRAFWRDSAAVVEEVNDG